MPFYLIPGDLLLLSPLYFVSPETYTSMAVTAGNGGLIPWQAGWATGIGRFQFVLGRELGATFYGYGFENTTVVPGATPGAEPRVVDFKSIHFDLPILEYRPYRAFDTKQSSAVLIQLFAGADVPKHTTVTWPPGAPAVKLENDLFDRPSRASSTGATTSDRAPRIATRALQRRPCRNTMYDRGLLP